MPTVAGRPPQLLTRPKAATCCDSMQGQSCLSTLHFPLPDPRWEPPSCVPSPSDPNEVTPYPFPVRFCMPPPSPTKERAPYTPPSSCSPGLLFDVCCKGLFHGPPVTPRHWCSWPSWMPFPPFVQRRNGLGPCSVQTFPVGPLALPLSSQLCIASCLLARFFAPAPLGALD
eukprot:GGOE01028913.1.p1 GENE.GGOE01028913.1~~GGOE01028913.1.p1  ORF type:complete len:171 (+),score=0.56 GGOE01028913.1:275-787(+)